MEATRNLCAQIPVSLHDRVREERESLGQSLSEYVIQILKDHFEGGKTTMAATKTLAFQIPEELCDLILRQVHAGAVVFNDLVLCRVG